MLREAVQAGTELGRAARSVMDAGRLVSDDIMIGIVRERLDRADAQRGFVLDGFPRTVTQAMALDDLLAVEPPLVVIDVEVPDDILVQRLSERRICASCNWIAAPGAERCAKCGGALITRRDDEDSVVRERLKVYGRDTQPIVDYYRQRSSFRSVDGDQTPDAVAADIAAAVASVVGGLS
jgi:adenylate kinase